MVRTFGRLALGACLLLVMAAPARAQVFASCPKQAKLENTGDRQRLTAVPGDPTTHPGYRVTGDVALTCDDVLLFADSMEYWEDVEVVRAAGRVTYISGTQRITAERLEFNTRTKLGTFWQAQGTLTISGKNDPKSIFGVTEAEAYFFGEKLEKIGADKYRLTNGRFTTCVQPTPRWDFVASTVVLVPDKRAVLESAVLRIKNVPVLYLPWFYYPINKEQRATGFLMPGWGKSTLRGQTLSNAFFWAINRSMDLTLNHEYASKTGQGFGAEFRYIEAPGSEGTVRFRQFNGSADDTTSIFTERTYQVDGNIVQALPGRLTFRGNLDYTNNLRTQQVLQQDLYASTNAQRYAAGSLQGTYGRLQLGAEAGITDIFTGSSKPVRFGTLPRVRADIASSPIGSSRVYVGLSSDFTALVRQDAVGDPASDRGLYRVDVNPTIRTPIGNLPFLAISAAAGYRFTYWSERLDASGAQVPQSISRRMADIRAEITGPTFTRIFSTPRSGYATKWKHVIQPTAAVSRITMFEDFAKVPKNDYVDAIYGGVTSVSYGLANRLLAKRPTPSGTAVAQEVASITLQQTYYSNAEAAAYDSQYERSAAGSGTTKLSPVAATASLQPTTAVGLQVHLEYDTKFKAVRTTSVGANVRGTYLTANASWSKQHFIEGLSGFNVKSGLYHSVNTTANLRTPDNHLGGTWAWSYDFQRKLQLQQRVQAYYQAQCCGVAIEYQVYNLGAFNISGVPQDKRFNFSISLAGIGTFSNLLGSFGR